MTAPALDFPAILRATAHRPWPVPARPWSMFQSWRKLLFAHWPVKAEAIRPTIPKPLELDLYDGSAWIGLVPFELCDLRPSFLPPVPWLSTFPEINVRTYVRHRGRAGVWFYSLDAASWPTVFGARLTFGLPYFRAWMSIRNDGDAIDYRSRRLRGGGDFRGRYRPSGPVFEASPGTLEHFLTERYSLFTVGKDGVARIGEVQHGPWPLQPAEAEFEAQTLLAAAGIRVSGAPKLFHFSARQDTLLWSPRRVE